MQNMDRLYDAVQAKGPVCVGLDTDFSYLPEGYASAKETKGEAIVRFNKEIVDATMENAGCYKVQIAYYEALGIDGMTAYAKTLAYLRDKKLLAIADIKRGDIAKTAEMYAKAHFEGEFEADFITLAPYMGLDSIEPYTPYFKEKGAFVLCRTSNGGAKDFEYAHLANGAHVYDMVGDKISEMGAEYMGERGYSALGLVIGGTHIEEAAEIRARYKNSFFLIPGYGAQGGTAKDIAQYLKGGNGGVVNASRSILLAYKKQANTGFAEAAYNECKNMREAIRHECSLL
ncbi:MAG: orotidine-5'-phosphate decarboxylase [Oscillospiraceae bacterium]